MAKIEVYSKEWCPYCTKAKALLHSKQLEYEEVDITSDAEGEQDMLDTNERGEIRVDSQGQTGVSGVFAAGDVTDTHDKQIVIAAGAGANAAMGAFEYLITQH